ncbi:MAG: hypothetical protein M3450_16385 [Actinomycetota bacterium]|nr:hypothetical protein [Actinomycetota bacterium]
MPLAALFYCLFALAFGSPQAHLFCAGFLAGYLAYDMTHYHLHHRRLERVSGRCSTSGTCDIISKTTPEASG